MDSSLNFIGAPRSSKRPDAMRKRRKKIMLSPRNCTLSKMKEHQAWRVKLEITRDSNTINCGKSAGT